MEYAQEYQQQPVERLTMQPNEYLEILWNTTFSSSEPITEEISKQRERKKNLSFILIFAILSYIFW
jgi:hypothetical protein